MGMSGAKRRKAAALAHQLFYAALGNEEFELPADASPNLRIVIEAAQRVTREVLAGEDDEHTHKRVEDLGIATLGLMDSPRAFADAIEKAESGARFGDGVEEVLFDVMMPSGAVRQIGFGSGTDAIAATLFQIAGIGRKRKSQAARQRKKARNAHAVDESPRIGGDGPSGGALDRGAAAPERKFSADAIVLAGPLADLLFAIRQSGRDSA